MPPLWLHGGFLDSENEESPPFTRRWGPGSELPSSHHRRGEKGSELSISGCLFPETSGPGLEAGPRLLPDHSAQKGLAAAARAACHPCPGHAHAQTVQTSGTCGAPGWRPGSVYECQGAKWGEDSGIPCPRRRASSWKVELAPGGMPRAQGVGICWRSFLRRAWGPTTAHHSGLPLTHSRARPAPSPCALSMGSSTCPLGSTPTTYRGPSPLAPGRTWKDSDTLLDSGQAPNGSLCWLEAIDWASLGLGPWSHPFTGLPSFPLCPQTTTFHHFIDTGKCQKSL